jgi:hypothetical protein
LNTSQTSMSFQDRLTLMSFGNLVVLARPSAISSKRLKSCKHIEEDLNH